MTITSQGLSDEDLIRYEEIKREARNDPQKELELSKTQARIVFDVIRNSTDSNLRQKIAALVKARILNPGP